MTRAQPPAETDTRVPRFWMRSLSFLALHRMIVALGSFPQGLRAGELNRVIIDTEILHRRGRPPKPTTLYHYRTMLLRLGAVVRRGLQLCIRSEDRDVAGLLDHPPPSGEGGSLSPAARNHFATMVLGNHDCLTLFFGRFMESASNLSVSEFRRKGSPVKYKFCRSPEFVGVHLENCATGKVTRIKARRTGRGSPPVVQAIPYGMRYWARDELGLIDEYCRHDDGSIIMFPILNVDDGQGGCAARRAAEQILSLRGPGEWTMFAIEDLIVQCCEQRRQPLVLLFRAIDKLMEECTGFIVMIPTPRSLATITAVSPGREEMELRQYYRYRNANGPYISHIRIHRDAELPRLR